MREPGPVVLRRSAIRPLLVIAIGLVLVAVEFRIRSLDLLPDPLGWLLIAVGAWRLALVGPAAVASIAAVLSLSDLLLPYRWIYVDPKTGEIVSSSVGAELDYPQLLRWNAVSDARAVAMAAAVLAGGVSLWWLLGDLQHRAEQATGAAAVAAKRLRTLQLLVPVAWVAPYLVAVTVSVIGTEPFDPIWNGTMEYVALAGLLSLLALATTLTLARNAAWALPPTPARPN
jgi:hypothetical protein